MLVTIPILPELQETLDAGPLGELCWFASVKGRPMTKESVGNFFKDRCVAAGIPDKSGHGVRACQPLGMIFAGQSRSRAQRFPIQRVHRPVFVDALRREELLNVVAQHLFGGSFVPP